MVNEENTMPEESPDNRTPLEEFLHHQRRALEETGKALEALLPEGFRVHSKNASQEFTKGFKVLVDAAMEELKQASKKDEQADDEAGEDTTPASTTGKTKVKVQVD